MYIYPLKVVTCWISLVENDVYLPWKWWTVAKILSRNYQYLFTKAVRSATCPPLALATDTGATIDRSLKVSKPFPYRPWASSLPRVFHSPGNEKTIPGSDEHAAKRTLAAVQISCCNLLHYLALWSFPQKPLALCNKWSCRVVQHCS